MENLILSKGLKRPSTKSSKISGISRTFFCIIYMSDYRTLMCRLASGSLGRRSRVNSAAGLDGTFIVQDVTALAFTQIINMRGTGH